MLAITLLFANLSKLVAICNILSKYCLCQNRKPFSDLPRQRCAHNCLPTTLHGPHRGEAWWGVVGLCPPLSSPGRLYLATFANLVADRTAVCLTQVFALPQCACGNPLPSLPHVTTRPWNTVRHRHSTQSSFNPP